MVAPPVPGSGLSFPNGIIFYVTSIHHAATQGGSSTVPTSSATPSANGFVPLGVPQQLADTLARQNITNPTPIQAATLPDSLAGRDVLGRGRTGSGKSYAFLLPTAARLTDGQRAASRRPRALVLAPTRELALQLAEAFEPLSQTTGLSSTTVFGGVGQNPQVKKLQRGVDVLVACPGRLLDLMGQGHIDLSEIDILVIDEADHMADMGFLPMVRRILDQVPAGAQKMLFSATLDAGVGVLVKRYLKNPVVHEADSAASPVAKMDHHVLVVEPDDRIKTLANISAAEGRTLVFTRTKHGAKRTAKQLRQRGVTALELHGNLSQNARTRNLQAFHDGAAGTLVATDIAARGIHVDDVELVIHADPPAEHKAYLHRSGRTARAGQAGTVITLATPALQQEVRQLMKAAKIQPTVHSDRVNRELLDELVPGPRQFHSQAEVDDLLGVSTPVPDPRQGRGKSRNGRSRGRNSGQRGGQGGQGSQGGQGGRNSRSGESSRTSRSGDAPRSGSRAGGSSRSSNGRRGNRRSSTGPTNR